MKHRGFLARFVIRWLVCSLGLWIAAGIFHSSVSYGGHIGSIIISGFILAVLNAVIRPILVLATLPAVLLTLGLFMVVINGITVYMASKLDPSLQINSFGVAILTGIIIGLVNYLVTAILEERN